MTDYVCHTSSVENAVRILECGKLLSPVRARKARASELQGEARNAANDPEDYFEYIMFAWGNCQAGDRLVMERKLGRFPDEKDLSEGFAPGVRFFFRYSDLIRHPGAVFEGVLPLKVRDEILLEDWVSAVIVPEINRQQVEPSVPKELESRVHFLQNDCKDIWEWSEKVYEYVRMNDMKYRKAEKADSGRIAELFREMLRTVCHTENVEGYEDGYLDRFFSGSGDLIYVAELGKEVVAFLSVQVYREDGYIYLDDFSVTAEYRGKGIGTKLIGMAEEYSESIGIPAIVLHVDKTNERARRLYRKLGYRDHEDQGNRILMVKDLFFR